MDPGSAPRFAWLGRDDSLWVVVRARHVDLEGFTPDEYREQVLGFLVETLRH